MNKIFNINLGGYPFTIDDDAYKHLNWYLDTIKSHFSDSEGCEEIVGDIEVRMAELFEEQMNGQRILTRKELDEVIKIMGTPQDFGAAAEFSDEFMDEPVKRTKRTKTRIKTGRRFFRDDEDVVVGGVCSGIAAYFGIEDPLWVRLGVGLLMFIGGIGFFPYIILWIIVPKAKTSGDRLSMRGEPVNVTNIGKMIEDEMHSFSETVSEFGREFGSKKKRVTPYSDLQDEPYRKGFLF